MAITTRHKRNVAIKDAAKQVRTAPVSMGRYAAVIEQILGSHKHPTAGGVMVGITSPSVGEGVTSVAMNLAMSAATARHETLLIDINTNQPKLSSRLGASQQLGWQDVLVGRADLFDCLQATTVPELMILPARPVRAGASDVFSPAQIDDFIRILQDRFEIIIADLPPTGELGACCHLVSQLNSVLLVLDAKKVSNRIALRARQQLEMVQADVLGVVLNRQEDKLPRWFGGTP